MIETRTNTLEWIAQPFKRLALHLMVGAGVLAAGHAQAQTAQTFGANDWLIYGTAYKHELDMAVPGHDIVVVPAGPRADYPWSSGASMPIPDALAAGVRITAVFWARSARPTRLSIGLQDGAPAYARFANADVMLTPYWRRVSVSGMPSTGFAANTHSLSVRLGQTGAEVMLGPVAFIHGKLDDAVISRTFAAFRPTERMIDVRMQSEPGVLLAGTLHLPTREVHGPFPLAVLIQGHGPNGRGGYTEIIKRLTAQGFAALEYDKRGIGQSTGKYEENIGQLTADAAAAIAAMRRRRDIDGNRVAVIGHSQGGVIAPAVAAADPTIAAVVTLAGSVGDGLPYLRRALYNQMIFAGRPQKVAAPAVDAAITLLQARIDNRDAETIATLRAAVIDRFEAAGFPRAQAEGALAMIDTEEARQANQLHAASDLRALRIPVLAVFGSRDPLVVASDEAAEARRVLANNPRAKVEVLEGLSHWFQEETKTGTSEEVAQLGPNAGSPRLLALVANWLQQVFSQRPNRVMESKS
jgi:pimeloyl-ACP methyl ester carboxylesterase